MRTENRIDEYIIVRIDGILIDVVEWNMDVVSPKQEIEENEPNDSEYAKNS